MKYKILLIACCMLVHVSSPLYASDICNQENLEILANTYPQIKTLIERHQQEQDKLEKELEALSGKSETELDSYLQDEKAVTEIDSIVTKKYYKLAQRQYAEFWELCTELAE